MEEILEILKPAFDKGMRFEIYYEGDTLCIDLNTQAKSGCVLKKNGDSIKAHMRYNKIETIEYFDDVLSAIYSCGHGRNYFNGLWVELLKENGYSDPKGNL